MEYEKLFEALLWLVFTFYFFYLWIDEKEKSKQKLESLEKFNLRREGGTRFDAGISPSEIFYAMRDELNKANQESHRISAQSFLTAALTSLLSFVISLF